MTAVHSLWAGAFSSLPKVLEAQVQPVALQRT